MGSDDAGALSLDSLGKLFDIKCGENVFPACIALSREGAGMRPEFRQPVDSRRRVAKDEARLTFGQGSGSFEAEGPRDNPLMSLVEDETRAYWAGLLTDTACHDVRAVTERILHEPGFRPRLSELLRSEKDRGVRAIVRGIIRKLYGLYERFQRHPIGQFEVHYNQGSADIILPPDTPKSGEEEHGQRLKRQWERRQAKKTHVLDEVDQMAVEVAVPIPAFTEEDVNIVNALPRPRETVELPVPGFTEQAPLFEADEAPTYQDLPAVQERWTGRAAPRKRRRNLKRTVGPEPLPLPSKPPSRAG